MADVLVEENFDCDFLCICQAITIDDFHDDLYIGESNVFEVLDYVEQIDREIE